MSESTPPYSFPRVTKSFSFYHIYVYFQNVVSVLGAHGDVVSVLGAHGDVVSVLGAHGDVVSVLGAHGDVVSVLGAHGDVVSVLGAHGDVVSVLGAHGDVVSVLGAHGDFVHWKFRNSPGDGDVRSEFQDATYILFAKVCHCFTMMAVSQI